MSVFMMFLELLQEYLLLNSLDFLFFRLAFALASENAVDLLNFVSVHGLWEFDFEVDHQIAVLVGRLVERHAQALARHHCVRLDDLARFILYPYDSTVKVHDCELNPCESLEKCYFFFHVQICALASVDLVGSDLYHGNHISWLDVRDAVTLA